MLHVNVQGEDAVEMMGRAVKRPVYGPVLTLAKLLKLSWRCEDKEIGRWRRLECARVDEKELVANGSRFEVVREDNVRDVAAINLAGTVQATGVANEPEQVVPRHCQYDVFWSGAQSVVDNGCSRRQLVALCLILDHVLDLANLKQCFLIFYPGT